MKAVATGHLMEARMLLSKGADIDQSVEGQTPLMLTVRTPGTELIDVLLQAKPDLNRVDGRKMTALMIFIEHGRHDLARRLIDAGVDASLTDANGRNALMHAAQAGAPRWMISALILSGADPNLRLKPDQTTALMMAAGSVSAETVQALLEGGSALDAQDASGQTAVFYAVLLNREANLRALIRAGAVVEIVDKSGTSPVGIALSPGRDGCLKALSEAGATIPQKNPAVHVGRGGGG